jgi:hypothetical protein
MTINDLVQGFAKHIKQLKAPDYKESQVGKGVGKGDIVQ